MEFKEIRVDGRVLCKDASTGIYYDAKIQDKEDEEFLIHYHGWNKRFDEWIHMDDTSDRILPFSKEILNQNKKLLNDQKEEAKRLAAEASAKKNSPPTVGRATLSQKSESPQESSSQEEDSPHQPNSRKRKNEDVPGLSPLWPSQPKTLEEALGILPTAPITSPRKVFIRPQSSLPAVRIQRYPLHRVILPKKSPGSDESSPCPCGILGCKLRMPIQVSNCLVDTPITVNTQLMHCLDCGAAFDNGTDLAAHYKRHLQEGIRGVAGSSKPGPSGATTTRYIVKPRLSAGRELVQSRHSCHVCKEAYLSSAALENHINIKHATRCAICHKFVLITQIEDHLRMHSVARRPVPSPTSAPSNFNIRCKRCRGIFDVAKFSEHQKLCRAAALQPTHSLFKCGLCDRIFRSREDRTAHVFSSHPDCAIKCKTCSFLMRSNKEYKDHTAVCSG